MSEEPIKGTVDFGSDGEWVEVAGFVLLDPDGNDIAVLEFPEPKRMRRGDKLTAQLELPAKPPLMRRKSQR